MSAELEPRPPRPILPAPSPVPEFVEIGLVLATIRDRRLYRTEYRTFDEYCRATWGFSRWRARQLIAAARVYVNW